LGSLGALLPEALRSSLGDQPRQPQQVVGCAAEDEDPVHLGQPAHLHLAERADLLHPAEGLFDQPAAAQADRVAGVPGGSSVHVRAPSVVVLGDVRRDLQGSRGGHEVLGVVSIFCNGPGGEDNTNSKLWSIITANVDRLCQSSIYNCSIRPVGIFAISLSHD